MEKKSRIGQQLGNVVAFLAVVLVNFLANYIPIGGRDTGYISDLYPNLFAPTGFTFAIWGVIYILLGMFAVYQGRGLLFKGAVKEDVLNRVGWLFIISCIANVLWIFAWHYLQIGLSLLCMLVLFLSLLAIYLRLGIGKRSVIRREKIFVHIPFSVYLGWITVATIANITVFLVDIGWQAWGFPHSLWTVIVLAVASLITYAIMVTRKDTAYLLVVVWALFGIFYKRLFEAEEVLYSVVMMAAASILFLLMILFHELRNAPDKGQKEEAWS